MNGNCKKWIFSMFMGHISINNCLIIPKIIKFHLDIIMINLYTNFVKMSTNTAKKLNGNCKKVEFF